MINDGVPSTRSDDGAARIAGSLAAERPAYVLILYGTNDWNLSACRRAFPCFTIENLRSMIRQAKAAGTVPVVGTIIPANPAYVNRLAADRNAVDRRDQRRSSPPWRARRGPWSPTSSGR